MRKYDRIAQRIIFFLFIIFLSGRSYSQICGSLDFSSIGQSCFKKYESKLDSYVIPLSNFESGDVYFYKTNSGAIGKLFIHAVEAKGNECEIYYDHENFGKGIKSSTAIIKNYLGVWDVQNINFDSLGGGSDFILKHNENISGGLSERCTLESEGGQIVKAGRYDPTYIKKNTILYIVAILLIGFAVFNISRVVFEEEDQYKTSETLNELDDNTKVSKNDGVILMYSRPFFKRYFNPIVAGMKNKKKVQEKYKRVIAASGMSQVLSSIDLFSFKLFLIIGFPVVFLGVRAFLEADWSLTFVPLMAVLGFIYPDIWINSKAETRKKEIVSELPFAVDMLALSVEAGLDFIAAMTKVLQSAPKSALVDEFETVIKEIQLGSTRAQALKQLAWRVDDLPVTSFCATLIAADSVGASIGPILKNLAGEIRQKRSSIIEKKGAAAASKMLIPMIVFILPAVVLIIFAPMAMQFMGN